MHQGFNGRGRTLFLNNIPDFCFATALRPYAVLIRKSVRLRPLCHYVDSQRCPLQFCRQRVSLISPRLPRHSGSNGSLQTERKASSSLNWAEAVVVPSIIGAEASLWCDALEDFHKFNGSYRVAAVRRLRPHLDNEVNTDLILTPRRHYSRRHRSLR